MGRRGLLVMLMLLTACSSGHKASAPPTTPAPASTTIESTTSTSTTTITTTTTTTVATAAVRIEGFTTQPQSPVACNAPTSVELRWTAVGATGVDLSVDGQPFAHYGGGKQDHLEPFACDGRAHTFVLTTRPAGATARLVISSKLPS